MKLLLYKPFICVMAALISLPVITFSQDTKSYVSSDKTFSISYPEAWKVNKDRRFELSIYQGTGLLIPTMLNIEIQKRGEGYENADIREISDAELQMMKTGQTPNVEILSSDFQEHNDHEWWVVKGKLKQLGKQYFTDTYKTIHSGKVYVFSYLSNEKNYEKNRQEALSIISSVRFLTKNEKIVVATKKSTGSNPDDRVNTVSDDRSNNAIPVISDKPLWEIKAATGWMKNKEGQWISGKNKIQKSNMSLSDSAAWNKGINVAGADNFIRMEVREVTIHDKPFIVFIKIMQDWRYAVYDNFIKPEDLLTRVKFYVIKKNAAMPKPTLDKDGSLEYEIMAFYIGYTPYEKDYLHNIALKLAEGDNKDPSMKDAYATKGTFGLYYKQLKDGKTSRFAFTVSGAESIFNPTPQPTDLINHLMYPDSYFECNTADISGLFNLIGKK